MTYHNYQGQGLDENLVNEAMEPNFYWSSEKYSRLEVSKAVSAGSVSKVWIGEGAMASHSGQAGVTDTFLSTMWFANALGSVAKTKPVPISTFCRQTLVGGHYGLLIQDTLDPLPDFYLMRLWTHIVGNQAVGPLGVKSTANTGNLLIHAFCGKNTAEVVLIVINIDSDVDFHLNIPWGTSRDEYLLQGSPNVTGHSILINGVTQTMGPDGSLLDIVPNTVTVQSRMNAPAHSVAFAVVKGTHVGVCRGDPSVDPPKEGGAPSAYTPSTLSPAALGAIVVAAALVVVLGCVICFCRGKEPVIRKRNAHLALAQNDNGDGLMLNMNIPSSHEDSLL